MYVCRVRECACVGYVGIDKLFFFTAGNVPPAGILYSKTAPGRVSGT
jgi:hypothetical protein